MVRTCNDEQFQLPGADRVNNGARGAESFIWAVEARHVLNQELSLFQQQNLEFCKADWNSGADYQGNSFPNHAAMARPWAAFHRERFMSLKVLNTRRASSSSDVGPALRVEIRGLTA